MLETSLPTAIFLMGPTATGKTQLALSLVQEFPLEIISVDSAMVYRGLDIGTAKPEASILASVPHHLINIREPIDSYSCASFRQDALLAMKSVLSRGKIPLLVGGTLLYFRGLQYGLSELPASDPHLREELQHAAKTFGLAAMHRRLEEVDPQSAARIHPNDPQRILRALEVYTLSGLSLSLQWQQNKAQKLNYNIINIKILPENRDYLHQVIEARFLSMLNQGLVAELSHLIAVQKLHQNLPALRSVGYRQVWAYLAGECSYEEMVVKAIAATRQLAKRQLTWLRQVQTAGEFSATHPSIAAQLKTFLHKKVDAF